MAYNPARFSVGLYYIKEVAMGTFITEVIVFCVVGVIIRSMIHDKKNGKSIQCGGDCKQCGGHCH